MRSVRGRDIMADTYGQLSTERSVIPPAKTFFIELTNHCNLRCTMCNFHSPVVLRRREKGFMSFDLVKKLLLEISGSSPERPWVALHGAGEPLLHRHLVRILQEAGLYKNLDTGFLTNAALLGPEKAREILDTPLSWIGFSIDGINGPLFNKYRQGADYETVRRNALNFVRLARILRPDLRIMVNMTVQEEMKKDVPDFVRFWLPEVNEVCISPCRRVGTRENPLVAERSMSERIPCFMLSTMMVIYWDGSVGLCCEDWFNDGRMGNAARDSLRTIWEGERFTLCRRLHDERRFSEIPLCHDCSSWYNALPEISFDEELGCSVTKTAWQYTYTAASGRLRQAGRERE